MTAAVEQGDALAAAGHPTRRLVSAGLALGIAFGMFVAGAWIGIYSAPIRLASVVLGVSAVGLWLVVAFGRPALRPRTVLGWPLAAALLAFAISSPFAVNSRLSLDYLAYAPLLVGLYLLLVRLWGDPFLAQRLGTLAALLCGGIGVLYVAAVVRRWMEFWATLGHFAVPPLRPAYEGLWFGNPNALASIQVLLLLVAAAHVGLSSRRRRRVVGILGVIVAVDVLLSGSRGAWLGIAVAGIGAGGAWLAVSDRRARAIGVVRRSPRLATAVIAALVVALLLLSPALASRIGEQAAETRVGYWTASLRMFDVSPLTGIGPGAWAPLRPAYTLSTDLDYYIPHAHNLPLHVLAELGLVGVAAAAVVVAGVARLLAAGWRSPDRRTRAWTWAVFVGLLYLGGQHLVDEYVHQPAVLIALALPIARLDERLQAVRARSARTTGGRLLVLALGLAVSAGAVTAFWSDVPALDGERATALADEGEWSAAADAARRAVAADPRMAPYQLSLALASARIGELGTARAAFRTAAQLDDFPNAWLGLAATSHQLGDNAEARGALLRALRLGSQQPEVAIAAAGLYLDLGDEAAARDALAAATVAAPSLASDPWWRTLPFREDAIDEAIAAAAPRTAFLIALEADRHDEAWRLADLVGGADGSRRRLAAGAWAGDAEAFAALVEEARARPLDPELVALCRRVAEHARETLANGATWMCDGAGAPKSYYVVRVTDVDVPSPMPGPDASIHARFAYRRTTPTNLLAPGLLRLQSTFP